MRLKSYFANSVQGAIDKARAELGPEAMLISSRQTDRDLQDVGAFEVVFGLMPAGAGGVTSAGETKISTATSTTTGASGAVSGTDLVLQELAELRRQVEAFSQSVSRSSFRRAAEQLTPDLAFISDHLMIAGFSAELTHDLVEAVSKRLERGQENRDPFARDLLYAVLEEEVASRFSVSPTLGDTPGANAVMLVGAPGAGKTTTLAKLALEYGIKARRSVHLLSLDTLRIAGCDQLAAYAQISGADFRPIQDVSALGHVLRELPPKGLVLVDTPGYATADQYEIEDLARALEPISIEVQLVMPAYVTAEAAQQIFERLAPLKPAKLLLTHLDAVRAPALPIEFSIRSGLALSYFGTGQQVPEDIKEVDKAALMMSILHRERTFSMAA